MLNILLTFLLMLMPLVIDLGLQFLAYMVSLEITAVYHLIMVLTGREAYGFVKYIFVCLNSQTNKNALMNMNLFHSLVIICVMGYWYINKYSKAENELKDRCYYDKPRIAAGILALSFGLQLASGFLSNAVGYLFPAAMEYYERLLRSAGLAGSDISLLTIIVVVMIGPLSEELLFRGVVLHIGKRRLSFAAANILQALLFGLFHMNLVQGVYAFVAGLFFGYVVNKCHSIKASYVFHLTFNFLGVFAGIGTGANYIFVKILIIMFTISLLVIGKNFVDDGVEEKGNVANEN